MIVSSHYNLFSQSDLAAPGTGHAGLSLGYWCGWDNATTYPLNIEHKGNQNINFKLGGTPSGQLDQSGNKNTTFGYYSFNATASGTDNSLFGDHAGNGLTFGTYNTFMGSGSGLVNTTGNQNTFLGMQAGGSNTTADNNTFTGFQSGLYNTTGTGNTFAGYRAGFGVSGSTTGDNNTFTGYESGKVNKTGSNNTFSGYQSGVANSTGSNNTFTGYQAGTSNSTNDFNTFVGYRAGRLSTGDQNTFIGSQTGVNNTGTENSFMGESTGMNNTTGNQNTFIGEETGFTNSTGNKNVYVGHAAGYSSKGHNNVAVGEKAGTTNTAGSFNTFIGTLADVSTSLTQATAIGFNAIATKDYSMILGGDSIRVGIGLSGVAAGPQAKLDVSNDATLMPAAVPPLSPANIAGQFITNGANSTAMSSYYGVFAQSYVKNATYNNIGGSFTAWNCAGNNIGVTGNADGAVGNNNMGGHFMAQSPTPGGYTNYGVKAEVQGVSPAPMNTGGMQNFGVYSVVYPGLPPFAFPAAVDVAIYGNCNPTSVNTPLTMGNRWAGYFDGDVNINGNCWNTFGVWISDQQFKTDIDSITGSLEIIKKLKPRTFYMDTLNQYGLNFSSKKQYGFIAQDVQQILPELVMSSKKPAIVDSVGNVITPGVSFIGLNYLEFIALLTKGIQEQTKSMDSLKTVNTKQDSINTSLQNQVDSLKANNSAVQSQLNTLSDLINECCNRNHSPQQMNNNGGNGNNNDGNKNNTTSQTDVKLTDGQSIILDQNSPNPFAEQTTIGYFLPDDVNKAQMLFYNAGGKLIQSVELTQRGKGQLNVFAQDLTNGLYTYTLVVDGKIFETKKMVKQ